MIKKLALVAVIAMSFSAVAQEGPVISSAIIAIDRNENVKEAKKYIDEAEEIISSKPQSEISSKDMSKFYYYKGLINYRVYNSKDEEISKLDTAALDKALEGFNELIEFEKNSRNRYSKQANEQLQYVTNDLANRAIRASQKKEFLPAYKDFMKVYEIKKQEPINQIDTSMLYNAGIMAQNAKMYDKALKHNQKLLELGYKGTEFKAYDPETGKETLFPSKEMMNRMVSSGKFVDPVVEGNVQPEIYSSVAGLALNQGDTALFRKTVEEGREKYPKDPSLLRSELQIFFDTKQYDKALANLDQAIEQASEEDKVVFHYNKGVILQTEMGRNEEAIEAYQKALELDSTYSDALYMTSIVYVDSANAVGKVMNDLPLSETEKYEKMKKQQEKIFEDALPYLEKAYESNPRDQQVITALRQVYRALRMYEKAQELPKTTKQ